MLGPEADGEAMEYFLEDTEADESDESDAEARTRWQRPKVASGSGLFRQRPGTTYVTQQQMQLALARVSAQIKTNSTAVATLTTRVNTVNDTIKKEQAARKKDSEAIRGDVRQMRDMTMLLPFLSGSTTRSMTANTAGLQQGDKVLIQGDTFSQLMPLLLLGGMGSGGGGMFGGSGSSGGSDNSMMMMMMVLAMSNR